MASVHDVAVYVLHRRKETTAMKLQKLVYYCQAWSLLWDEKAIFPEKIEAWANGPVVKELYQVHKGKYSVSPADFPQGDLQNTTKDQRETIEAVLDYYGDKSSQWLSDLTHMEAPWKNARKGLDCNERSNKEIKLSDMEEYYGGLAPEQE